MYIGTQLRKLRDKRKLSQQQVADHLGIAQSTYWNWESDECHFKMDHLQKLSELFEVDADDILPEGSVVKIVNNKENKDSSVNAFEVRTDEKATNEKLVRSLEEIIALLKEQNIALKEENSLLKAQLNK